MRAWPRDTLFLRLFVLIWAALVISHLAAFQFVTGGLLMHGPLPGGRSGHLPTFPSLPPTPGLPESAAPPRPGPRPGEGAPPGPPGLPAHLLVLDYGVRLVLIGAAAWLGARWLARPMQRLAHASGALAATLGRGPGLPRLDESRGTVEVREAARVFNRMAGELHEQFQSRGLLMASLSHDLRTPLTRMRIRLEPLAGEPVPARCIADIREMDDLIEIALEVFRNAHAPETAQDTDLHALVQALVDDLAEQGQAVTLKGEPLVLRLQPVATRRIVSNLLGNALRYGSRADVAVGVEDRWACIVIDDNGPGIAPAQLEEVQRPFHRVEGSRGRDSRGTGLGLYIVRDLTQRQGGELRLGNRAGGGLRATVRLPLG